MILKYILCIAAFFALWMTVVSGRPMNDTLTSGLEVVQRVERATSDESPERKPADPDVLGMGFRNRVYQRTPNPTVVNRVATSNKSPERKPADPDVLGMGFRNKRTETSDDERKPADPDVLGMGFRNRVYQRTPNPTVVNRVATSNESPERKPADPDVLGMGFRNKRTKPREPKNREAKKFLRLLGKTCEGKLPKMQLPKLPKDCRGN